MIGVTELMILIIVGAIIFFFGKNQVKEWFTIGKEIKKDAKEITE